MKYLYLVANIVVKSGLILSVFWVGLELLVSRKSILATIYFILVLSSIMILRKSSKNMVIKQIFIIFVLWYGIEGLVYIENVIKKLPPNGVVDGVEYTWGETVIENELGFRDDEIGDVEAEKTFNILVLGDSITWGVGVAKSDRFTEVLERMLNSTSSAVDYRVYNLASRGGNTAAQVRVLENHVDKIMPDLIVIGFNENDVEPAPVDSGKRENVISIINYAEGILSKINLYTSAGMTREVIWQSAQTVGYVEDFESRTKNSYDPRSVAWKSFKESLISIKSISDKRELPMPVIEILNVGIFTDRPNIFSSPDSTLNMIWERNDRVAELSTIVGYNVINNKDAIASQMKGEILSVNSNDLHPNSSVHEIYATTLYELLVNKYNLGRSTNDHIRSVSN